MLVSLARLVRTSSCRKERKTVSLRHVPGTPDSQCPPVPRTWKMAAPWGRAPWSPKASSDGSCQVFPAHLEDLDLCGVCGADVETLQIGLKHPLCGEPAVSVTLMFPPCQGHPWAGGPGDQLPASPHSTPELTGLTPPVPGPRLTRLLMDMVATFCSTTYWTSLWGQRGDCHQWGRPDLPPSMSP